MKNLKVNHLRRNMENLKVKDFIKKLTGLDQELEIVVDMDENGWYTVEDLAVIKVTEEELGNTVLNIKTSNNS